MRIIKTLPEFLLFMMLFLAMAYCKAASSDTTLVKKHIAAITKTGTFRTHKNTVQPDQTADYIKTV